MNASEVLDGLAALPDARDSGVDGNGITTSIKPARLNQYGALA